MKQLLDALITLLHQEESSPNRTYSRGNPGSVEKYHVFPDSVWLDREPANSGLLSNHLWKGNNVQEGWLRSRSSFWCRNRTLHIFAHSAQPSILCYFVQIAHFAGVLILHYAYKIVVTIVVQCVHCAWLLPRLLLVDLSNGRSKRYQLHWRLIY